jgi:hypothetical protein
VVMDEDVTTSFGMLGACQVNTEFDVLSTACQVGTRGTTTRWFL